MTHEYFTMLEKDGEKTVPNDDVLVFLKTATASGNGQA